MIDRTIEQELSENGQYLSTTVGTSMWPMLRDRRDTVVIHPVQGELKRGDVALYRYTDGHYVLHRVLGIQEGSYVIAGDNRDVRELVLPQQVIGVLAGFYRGQRWVTTDSRRYGRYARFVCATFPVRRIRIKITRGVRSLAVGAWHRVRALGRLAK